MKKLGVIGGMGPMATAYFMQMLAELTQAERDQEHMELMIHSCPDIPDRTAFLLGKSKEDPTKAIAHIGNALIDAGAQMLAIPCVAAASFYEQLCRELSVPILNIIEETVNYITEKGFKRAGLMAADGTLASGKFVEALQRAGVEVMLPDENGQKDIMHLIFENIKAGKQAELGKFLQVSGSLHRQGAEVVILGCTELSVISCQRNLKSGYVDSMWVLAKAAVRECGNLKEQL